MITKIIKIAGDNYKEALSEPAKALQEGEIVAFPTETVYGLGAAWNDAEAVYEIFKTKGRPQDNPLIVHVAKQEDMKSYFAFWDELAEALTKAFCPGPFTLIMPKAEHVNSPVTAGLDTVGIRVPSNKIARELISLAKVGIAAPSANLSGKPSPTTLQDCVEDLEGKVKYIIDGGDCEFGVESTIVSWDGVVLKLLRPGAISEADIKNVLSEHNIDVDLVDKTGRLLDKDEKPEAPGMKYRHYAPKAEVNIINGSNLEEKLANLNHLLTHKNSEKVGLLVSEKLAKFIQSKEEYNNFENIITFRSDEENREAAHNLFKSFRMMDRNNLDLILVEAVDEIGSGKAFMNRLRKASVKGDLSYENKTNF